jgi:hypothetical protein
MPISNVRCLATCVALVMSFAQAASAADILVTDAKSQPESITIAPGGVLIAGSASSPFVYKIPAGSSTAEKFIDVTSEGPGTFFYGMLADASSKTLWTCQVGPVPGTTPVQHRSALRGFDLFTGAPKLRWDLPGDSNTCNDLSLGPDGTLYFTDTPKGRIFALPAGATSADLFLDNHILVGIDGITFVNGVLYVNNVITSRIYRIPVDPSGNALAPIEITLDKPIKGPDGMRAANGKLFVAENGGGKITVIDLSGDTGTVTVLKDGLSHPTAIEPAGDTLWYSERAIGMVHSMPLPK